VTPAPVAACSAPIPPVKNYTGCLPLRKNLKPMTIQLRWTITNQGR